MSKHIVTRAACAIAVVSGAFLIGWATGAQTETPEQKKAAELKWVKEKEDLLEQVYSSIDEMALLSIKSSSGEVRASARLYFDTWTWSGVEGNLATAKAIRPYLQEVESGGQKAVRALEVVGLLGWGADIVIPDVLRLAEERPGLSTLAYEALGNTGLQTGTVPALVEAFTKARAGSLDYLTSARALARLKYRGIIPGLLKAIETEGKPRTYAAEVLGIYSCLPSEAEKAIVAALTKEKDAATRAYLLRALGKCEKWTKAAEAQITKGLGSKDKAILGAAIGATRCRADLKAGLIKTLVNLTSQPLEDVPFRLRNQTRHAIMTLPGSRILDVLEDIVKDKGHYEAARAMMLHSEEGARRAEMLVADGEFFVPKYVTNAIPRRVAYIKPLRRLILAALRDESAAPIAVRKILVHDLYLEAYIKPLETIAKSDDFSDETREKAIDAIDKIKEAHRSSGEKDK